ncbi:MAG: endolytic transglycosylase MltG [Gammaproteobacteria bacterium]|nr:endolytic transglycosylase MltG [Gammaproteobacteria bacterium]
MKRLIAILLSLVLVAGGVVTYVAQWNRTPLEVSETVTISLNRGESFISFAQRLESEGVVSKPRIWSWLARIRGLARRVKAGEYAVAPTDTPESLLQRLVAGEVLSYEIQLIEGWTTMQSVRAITAHDKLSHTLRGVDVETLLDVLGLPGGHAEGLFFPDTYRFVGGDSDADILRRAYAKMQDVLESEWTSRDLSVPYDTPYEALIAASLIEKETGREEDREHVSQVFASRLLERMKLQTDPSVIYGLGDQFQGNLQRHHLRQDSPYNTYIHRGLPPTPIALPGVKSIAAAMHPGSGNFLYFVSRGDGSSQFSTSLAEHRAAVRKYQL